MTRPMGLPSTLIKCFELEDSVFEKIGEADETERQLSLILAHLYANYQYVMSDLAQSPGYDQDTMDRMTDDIKAYGEELSVTRRIIRRLVQERFYYKIPENKRVGITNSFDVIIF